MARCPNLLEFSARESFNDVLKHVGGKALRLEDVRHRNAYLEGLSAKERAAYDRAHYLWDHEDGDRGAVGKHLDLFARLDEALGRETAEQEGTAKRPSSRAEQGTPNAEEGRSAAAETKSVSRPKASFTVTKAEILKHLEENRVEVRESVYRNEDENVSFRPWQFDESVTQVINGRGNIVAEISPQGDGTLLVQRVGPGQNAEGPQGWTNASSDMVVNDLEEAKKLFNPTKWSRWSLDPSNPTYRETVIHLPAVMEAPDVRIEPSRRTEGYWDATITTRSPRGFHQSAQTFGSEEAARAWADETVAAAAKLYGPTASLARENFTQGHFSEPNVIAHARTSLQKDAQGKPVFLVDELQSDWGQKLREGGVRDEEKIAELRDRVAKLKDAIDPAGFNSLQGAERQAWFILRGESGNFDRAIRKAASAMNADEVQRVLRAWEFKEPRDGMAKAMQDYGLAEAELRTAEVATPGHPLVNTTDQWTTTAFRRLIRQAVEAGADHIAITPARVQSDRGMGELVRSVRSLRYAPEAQDLQYVGVESREPQGWRSLGKVIPPDKLSDYVGKEMAEKLLAAPKERDTRTDKPERGEHEWHVVRDLKSVEIGGHGMRATYDGIYPKTLGKILAKMDPSIKAAEEKALQSSLDGRTFLPSRGNRIDNAMADNFLQEAGGDINRALVAARRKLQSLGRDALPEARPALNGAIAALEAEKANPRSPILFHSFPLTPKVKAAVMKEGMPLFSFASSLGRETAQQGEAGGRPSSLSQPATSLAEREAAARAVMDSPEWMAAAERPKADRDTSKQQGYLTPEWKAARRYVGANGEEIKGFDAALSYLATRAEAKVPGGFAASEKRAFIVIGYPGGGKSTISAAVRDHYLAIHMGSDDAKPIIPEYEDGKNTGGVHQESSDLNYTAAAAIAKSGKNLIFETLGTKGGIDNLAQKMKDQGYTVSLVHVDTPKAIAMERAVARYKQDGRAILPETYKTLKAAQVYDNAKATGVVDEAARIRWDEASQSWQLGEASSGLQALGDAVERGLVGGRGERGDQPGVRETPGSGQGRPQPEPGPDLTQLDRNGFPKGSGSQALFSFREAGGDLVTDLPPTLQRSWKDWLLRRPGESYPRAQEIAGERTAPGKALRSVPAERGSLQRILTEEFGFAKASVSRDGVDAAQDVIKAFRLVSEVTGLPLRTIGGAGRAQISITKALPYVVGGAHVGYLKWLRDGVRLGRATLLVNAKRSIGAGETAVHEWAHFLDHIAGQQHPLHTGAPRIGATRRYQPLVLLDYLLMGHIGAAGPMQLAWNFGVLKRWPAVRNFWWMRPEMAKAWGDLTDAIRDGETTRTGRLFRRIAGTPELRKLEKEQKQLVAAWESLKRRDIRAAKKAGEYLEETHPRPRNGWSEDTNKAGDALDEWYDKNGDRVEDLEQAKEYPNVAPIRRAEKQGRRYYATPHELFARAFQVYVSRKAMQAGYSKSEVRGIFEEAANYHDRDTSEYMHPSDPGTAKMMDAFDRVFSEIRVGERGQMMFSAMGAHANAEEGRSAASEQHPVSRPYTANFTRRLPEFAPKLEAELRRFVPDNVAIRLVDRLFHSSGEEMYARVPERSRNGPAKWAIEVALSPGGEPASYLHALTKGAHEATHILREMGMWDDAEWRLLTERASKLGMDKRLAERAAPEGSGAPNMLEFYRQTYREGVRKLFPNVSDQEALDLHVDEHLAQEYVANMVEDYVGGKASFGARIDGLLERIKRFFEALRNALHGLGFRTADDVLERAFGEGAGSRREGERFEPTFGDLSPAEMMSFAGPKAKTAPLSSLRLAESMEAKGRDKDYIFKSTGWFKGPDNMWRFEIDDSAAKLINLDKVLKKPSAGFFRSLMGVKPAGMPAWYKGNVKVASGVKLSEILSHQKLFDAYPFLKEMRASIIVGKGVPKSRSGTGSLIFREEGGKVIYSPIQIRAQTVAEVLPVLVHELQHYSQKKEGFAAGSSTSAREGDFPVRPLLFPQGKLPPAETPAEPIPITVKGEKFSPTTIAAMGPAGGLEGDWRHEIAGLTKAERLALFIGDTYDKLEDAEKHGLPVVHSAELYRYTQNNFSREELPRDNLGIKFAREKLLPRLQAELMSALRVKTEDYLSSIGEKEADAVMERLGYTQEQRRSMMPDYGKGIPSTIVTPDFREAADAVVASARRTQAIRDKWVEPIELTPNVIAERYDEHTIGFSHSAGEGLRLDMRAFIDPQNGRAVLALDREALEGSIAARALTQEERNELVDAAEKHMRQMNLFPTADRRLMPSSRYPWAALPTELRGDLPERDMSDEEFAFWRSRDPMFMMDDPRAFKHELEKIAKAKYGDKATVDLSSRRGPRAFVPSGGEPVFEGLSREQLRQAYNSAQETWPKLRDKAFAAFGELVKTNASFRKWAEKKLRADDTYDAGELRESLEKAHPIDNVSVGEGSPYEKSIHNEALKQSPAYKAAWKAYEVESEKSQRYWKAIEEHAQGMATGVPDGEYHPLDYELPAEIPVPADLAAAGLDPELWKIRQGEHEGEPYPPFNWEDARYALRSIDLGIVKSEGVGAAIYALHDWAKRLANAPVGGDWDIERILRSSREMMEANPNEIFSLLRDVFADDREHLAQVLAAPRSSGLNQSRGGTPEMASFLEGREPRLHPMAHAFQRLFDRIAAKYFSLGFPGEGATADAFTGTLGEPGSPASLSKNIESAARPDNREYRELWQQWKKGRALLGSIRETRAHIEGTAAQILDRAGRSVPEGGDVALALKEYALSLPGTRPEHELATVAIDALDRIKQQEYAATNVSVAIGERLTSYADVGGDLPLGEPANTPGKGSDRQWVTATELYDRYAQALKEEGRTPQSHKDYLQSLVDAGWEKKTLAGRIRYRPGSEVGDDLDRIKTEAPQREPDTVAKSLDIRDAMHKLRLSVIEGGRNLEEGRSPPQDGTTSHAPGSSGPGSSGNEGSPEMASFMSGGRDGPHPPSREERVESALNHVADGLGIMTPTTTRDLGDKVISIPQRQRIIGMANEAGAKLMEQMGPALRAALASHSDELAGYAPRSADPIGDGFLQFARDYIAWPNTAERRAPNLFMAIGDVLDAHNPALLQHIEEVQEDSRRVDKVGGNTQPPIPPIPPPPPVPSAAGGGSGSGPGRFTSMLRSYGERFKLMSDVAHDLAENAIMSVTPMASQRATARERAIAKGFANANAKADAEWQRYDDDIVRRFSAGQRERMWIALDEQSVAAQQGRDTRGIGLDRLDPDERAYVERLNTWADDVWQHARDVGLVDHDGLPFYAPRMLIRVAEGGDGTGQGSRAMDRRGGNLRTTTPQLRHRKHMTAEETEAAGKALLGDYVELARDIRTLPLAIAKLQKAIAGRSLINQIRDLAKITGREMVHEGGIPAGEKATDWFTDPHPAFKVYRPDFTENKETGKTEPKVDQNGDVVIKAYDLHIPAEFAGPLKAVLTEPSGKLYQAAMTLKGKVMATIMFSPNIHNSVELFRAFFSMPGKLLTLQTYFRGNAIKRGLTYDGGDITDLMPVRMAKDVAANVGHAWRKIRGTESADRDYSEMDEFLDGGLRPIGHRGAIQDITGMMEEPHMGPRPSWTGAILSHTIGLLPQRGTPEPGERLGKWLSPREGIQKTKADVAELGRFWHETLLWDRIADLQVGLAANFRDDLIAKGVDRRSAVLAASEMANLYAGSLPMESMSARARKVANLVEFSRSFTFGNIAAMKNALAGLPKDSFNAILNLAAKLPGAEKIGLKEDRIGKSKIGGLSLGTQAMIREGAGDEALEKIRGYAKRKQLVMVMADIAAFYISLSLMQDYYDWLLGQKTWGEWGQDYAKRGKALMQRTIEHPFEVMLHPIHALESLSSTSKNEPGKKDRVLIGYDKDGTAEYMRPGFGKISEDMIGWMSGMIDMIHRKESTFVRPLDALHRNDRGFGHRLYNPYAETTAEQFDNLANIAWELVKDQTPADTFHSIHNLAGGYGDQRLSRLKLLGPFVGATFSRGYPQGPAEGFRHRAEEIQNYKLDQVRQKITELVQDKKEGEARKIMNDLKIPEWRQRWIINTTINPKMKLDTKRAREGLAEFRKNASPDELDGYMEALRRKQQYQPPANTPR